MAHFPSEFEPPPAPFDACAERYDDVFTNSRVGRAQRASVWREMDLLFKPGQRILEINCGTGVDALHLAESGVRVVACDASRKMIGAARDRLWRTSTQALVDLQTLPTEKLGRIEGAALFDGALSNFSGLNCVEDLSGAGQELARLLKPRATLLLCVFGRQCAWEILWYLLRRNPRKAFRRVAKEGAWVQFQGADLRVDYPSVEELKRAFAPYFRLKAQKGVGILVPPSYLEAFAVQYPRAFRTAVSLDLGLGRIPLLRSLADHILLTFERAGD